MKQRWINIIKNNLLLIAAAFVAAIVIAVVMSLVSYKHTKIGNSIKDLQNQTHQANQEFTDKYRKMSASDREELIENLQNFFESLMGRNEKYEFHSFNEVKGILHEYPSEYAYVVQDDNVYSLFNGRTAHGVENFDNFVANCRLGKPGYVVISVFSINLDPIYYFIEYDGNSYHVVVDQTRDGFIDPYGYVENFGRYLKIECYKNSDGSITECGFLTDDIGVNYSDVINYYKETEAGKTGIEEPSYWQFLMISITKEDQKDRMLVSDRLSKEFVTNYTGYVDIHPDFYQGNEQADYDGDEILDRIYREYQLLEGNSVVNMYMFLGNGNTISLGRNVWGTYFYTCMSDITGDGNDDICFVQYDKKNDATQYSISIFEYRNGNYISMKLPKTRYGYINISKDAGGKSIIEYKEGKDSEETLFMYYEDGEWKTKEKN